MPRIIQEGSPRSFVFEASRVTKGIAALLVHCQERGTNALKPDALNDLKMALAKSLELTESILAAMLAQRKDNRSRRRKER